MIDPEPIDVKEIVAQILKAGKTYYYIAKLMRRQVVQIQRIAKSGRCQPHERDMLIMIRDDCLQNVTASTTQSAS